MNWDQIKGNWKQMSGKVRERWGKLTDDDLERAKGSQEQMIGALQERYGYTKEQAQREVDDFSRSLSKPSASSSQRA